MGEEGAGVRSRASLSPGGGEKTSAKEGVEPVSQSGDREELGRQGGAPLSPRKRKLPEGL